MIFTVMGSLQFFTYTRSPKWPVRAFDDFTTAKAFANELIDWFINNAEMINSPYSGGESEEVAVLPSSVKNEMDPLLQTSLGIVRRETEQSRRRFARGDREYHENFGLELMRLIYMVVPFPEIFDAPLTHMDILSFGRYVIMWDAYEGVTNTVVEVEHPIYSDDL